MSEGQESPLDVVCFGETLVDFLPSEQGKRVRDVPAWHPCPGGSPANVSVGLARLGLKPAMLGVVGSDEFGHFLKDSLSREGVDVSHLRQTTEARTGLVFICLDAKGERSFTFFRTRSAEFLLGQADVDADFLLRARAVHCGSNSLQREDAQLATVRMLGLAREADRIVSCDPNLRLHAWEDPTQLKALLARMLPLCTVVKLSEEEIGFVTGTESPEEALTRLSAMGVKLPVVTLGERGALFRWKGEDVHVPAPRTRVVDTTGAGDGFVAGLLHGLVRWYGGTRALESATREELVVLATFACAVGSRVVEKPGAVEGLPRAEELSSVWPSRPVAR
ncbi:fructokinase [Myxococcus fulvus]|uniref:Aminoimidazole riboside kinase n=1 Tax=Myxococcus fulvus TaxID=33 RepID=A0A511TG58_MYXFU|nr:carbohydrate kinase [Myxococcus fulvus]GEN13166.1 aminoimidazole riboside kinase [Myxococcus fulvus]SEU42085.1 fructokinase [Myxococcus fulvus]